MPLIIMFLFIHYLLQLAYYAAYTAYLDGAKLNFDAMDNLGWADSFIYVFTIIVTFAGLAVIGLMRPSSKLIENQKYEGVGQNHVYHA